MTEERALPAYLNGRAAEDWIGLRVRVPAGAHHGYAREVVGMVTSAHPQRVDHAMVCYLTVAEPEGFLYPGVDCRAVEVVR